MKTEDRKIFENPLKSAALHTLEAAIAEALSNAVGGNYIVNIRSLEFGRSALPIQAEIALHVTKQFPERKSINDLVEGFVSEECSGPVAPRD